MSRDLATLLERIAADIGPRITGRIATPDGMRFFDFDAMECDPVSFAQLQEHGTAAGWTPRKPATSD
jgi:hypothetical protein